jgi:hypothetical protein
VFSSPRRRRRLLVATATLLVVVPLIYLAARNNTSGSPRNANGPYVKDSFYDTPVHAPFTAAKRHAVSGVLARFIDGAVARHDLAGTWELAGPGLRSGLSYEEWRRGEIPVVPYAASKRGAGTWNVVNYSYRNRVGLELLLHPVNRTGQAATVETDLVRGHDHRWRVDYWMVTKLHGPGSAGAADSASAMSEGPPNVHKLPGKGKKRLSAAPRASAVTTGGARLDARWLLAPLGLVLLVILLPVGRAAAGRRRERRSEI